MKIKVISCGCPTWWYTDELGKEFEVEQNPYDRSEYWCESEGGALAKADCEVVQDTAASANQKTQPQVSLSQVGNIDSSEKGSGARYNSGKPDYSLLLLSDFADYLHLTTVCMQKYIHIISTLGEFQKTHSPAYLFDILESLTLEDTEEATHVFTYGAKKYKAWNWAKGFNWSIPLACAVRHTMAIINGEEVDAESGRKHIGHVVCNLFMLIHCIKYYKEGNDLPPKELFEDSYE